MALTELTLTRMWRTYHNDIETKELEEGLVLEYYDAMNQLIDDPHIGTIRKNEEHFYIEWKDGAEDTILNGSDLSTEILRNCGWKK